MLIKSSIMSTGKPQLMAACTLSQRGRLMHPHRVEKERSAWLQDLVT